MRRCGPRLSRGTIHFPQPWPGRRAIQAVHVHALGPDARNPCNPGVHIAWQRVVDPPLDEATLHDAVTEPVGPGLEAVQIDVDQWQIHPCLHRIGASVELDHPFVEPVDGLPDVVATELGAGGEDSRSRVGEVPIAHVEHDIDGFAEPGVERRFPIAADDDRVQDGARGAQLGESRVDLAAHASRVRIFAEIVRPCGHAFTGPAALAVDAIERALLAQRRQQIDAE